MPELPEVEVIRRGLEPHVLGHTIDQVEVYSDRSVRRHPGGAADLRSQLLNRRITSAHRRGKYLWLALDETDALVIHLGMSGQLLINSAIAPGQPHLRVRFGVGGRELRFVDQRTFGHLFVAVGGAVEPVEISHIGLDPLDPAFDAHIVAARFGASRRTIKTLLLDQTIMSGVGNIYADEALWAAQVHPATPGQLLSTKQRLAVIHHCRAVMLSALSQGGTSFDALYVNVDGAPGYFARSLQVYQRQDRPCSRCGAVVQHIRLAQRSTHFCSRCQPPLADGAKK